MRHRHWLLAGWLLAASALAAPMTVRDAAPEWRYTLRPGDTLIGVAAQYLARPADWPQLQRHNRIADPYRLTPGSALRIPLILLRSTPAPATVVAVSGQARLRLPGEAERALRAGEQLLAGAVLATAADSSATLRFADGSLLVLQPGARLALDTVSVYAGGGMVDTRLRLQQGRIEISANPRRTSGSRLQVITPSAVAAVRGTRFRVAADADITREETLEGAVALSAAGQHVVVADGQGSLAQAGQPPRPPVALLAAPDVSALPARIDALPLRFALPLLPGAAAWLGQIGVDQAFQRVLLEKSSSTPQLSFADLPDGDYVLRVRAADGQGLQGRDALHAFKLDARPFAPLSIAPGARVRSAQPDFQWSAVVSESAAAMRYRFQLARDAAFAEVLLDERTPDTRIKPAQALAPGVFYWRVASIEGADQGPFSPTQRVAYDPLPGVPDLGQTAPLFARNTLTLQLPPPPAGLRHELVLARDAARNQIVWQGGSSDGAVQASPVAPEKLYLAARLAEADGAVGPDATRVIEAPPRFHWEMLLLLLPLLAM